MPGGMLAHVPDNDSQRHLCGYSDEELRRYSVQMTREHAVRV
jgi:hypothetical protein